MKTYGGVDALTIVSQISAIPGSGHFTPGAHWIRKLGGPKGQSGRYREEKMFDPSRTRIPDT
jgi:hypothetical protein